MKNRDPEIMKMKKSKNLKVEDRDDEEIETKIETMKNRGNREKEPMKNRENPRKTPIAPELTPCGWYLFLTKIIKQISKKRRKSVKNALNYKDFTKTLKLVKIGRNRAKSTDSKNPRNRDEIETKIENLKG